MKLKEKMKNNNHKKFDKKKLIGTSGTCRRMGLLRMGC